ncbi:hypothetical protein CCACVL1_09860 [Corchorus capsularis]|uniref:Uncharacterized protein n=1 Tax=Corchorus capsularis TaxID=210143 RepID=A0A1R3ITW8_COCAP|nr:hypothetical protein CCACVL1_09860 [Corchorus capsularis]
MDFFTASCRRVYRGMQNSGPYPSSKRQHHTRDARALRKAKKGGHPEPSFGK